MRDAEKDLSPCDEGYEPEDAVIVKPDAIVHEISKFIRGIFE